MLADQVTKITIHLEKQQIPRTIHGIKVCNISKEQACRDSIEKEMVFCTSHNDNRQRGQTDRQKKKTDKDRQTKTDRQRQTKTDRQRNKDMVYKN
jgi:stage III sporulation protein SpoIIIAA